MLNQLTENAKNLRQELLQIQETFNTKKEQLIKIEGALEALSLLSSDEKTEEEAETEEV